MSTVHLLLILTIAKISAGEIFNESSSDEIQGTSCPFDLKGLRSKFGDGSNVFQFVMHGVLLPIVALFGLVCNLISVFIFTRREMTASINLIFTGKTLLKASVLSPQLYLSQENNLFNIQDLP